ncbi:VPLPA-CTERM sorting domain-containing protein [uncultured Tateyamaria sp.]|uniref:VPLPA-CTERM sorting domain-containing protein n=1 Tax=uncultured Tateyamaria sp. TaxID=455651 RepID=UPI00262F1727|nr:VPLPA-CTERM sorting domain-containing protein [uncultured Tateyamaria sp.]
MIKLLCAAAVLALGATASHATVLNFDSTADCTTFEVTITTGPMATACQIDNGGTLPGVTALVATGVTTSFWTATFNGVGSGISVDLGDGGSDSDRLFLTAFDLMDNVIENVTLDISGSTSGLMTLALSTASAAYIRFGVTGEIGNGGILADNLTFTVTPPSAVPLPAGALLLLGGLGGLAALRRKSSRTST